MVRMALETVLRRHGASVDARDELFYHLGGGRSNMQLERLLRSLDSTKCVVNCVFQNILKNM